jgi:hypothetical protein
MPISIPLRFFLFFYLLPFIYLGRDVPRRMNFPVTHGFPLNQTIFPNKPCLESLEKLTRFLRCCELNRFYQLFFFRFLFILPPTDFRCRRPPSNTTQGTHTDGQPPGLTHMHESLTQTALHIHNYHMEARYGHRDTNGRQSSSSINVTVGNSTRPNSPSLEASSHDDLYWNHNSSGYHGDNISPPQEHHEVAQPATSGTDTSRDDTQFASPKGLKQGRSATWLSKSPAP